MAQSNFYGSWIVCGNTNTSFGPGVEVTIAPGLDLSTATVTIGVGSTQFEGTFEYEPTNDSLVASAGLPAGMAAMSISRYVDTTNNFYALYALVVRSVDAVQQWPPLGSWVARLDEQGTGRGMSVAPGSPSKFDGLYEVFAAGGVQFGFFSRVTLSNDGTNAKIENAFNQIVGESLTLTYDATTASLDGSLTVAAPGGLPVPPMEYQIAISRFSFFSQDHKREFVYGVTFVGDPEQAGTWGAETGGSG
ncbi:MAG: hypothetical protein AAGD38_01195 [Acidobacteriota bacterium]